MIGPGTSPYVRAWPCGTSREQGEPDEHSVPSAPARLREASSHCGPFRAIGVFGIYQALFWPYWQVSETTRLSPVLATAALSLSIPLSAAVDGAGALALFFYAAVDIFCHTCRVSQGARDRNLPKQSSASNISLSCYP